MQCWSRRKKLTDMCAVCALLPLAALAQGAKASGSAAGAITGFRNSAAELQLEQQFLAVPSPQLAEEHMRAVLPPHIAGSEEDRKTAEYVARKFREAGLRRGSTSTRFGSTIRRRSGWT